ncbi:hypothetical protein UFOVP1545_23 [uncultured Caudovirales phage]|uniref:Uncharacterized protein n=1 Tax=uncultured Caudovirales phage TaxID=2100421 RepID=A0A6J7XCD9_9CAUD|nr:hypothetical protein UFOVP1545_23 [uncultured Caudovirales phage]
MPSKLNSEFNYRYQVLGNTPWEKIKILKGFLEGRVRAVALEEVSHLKHEAKVAELEYLKAINAPKHEQLKLQAELVETASHMVVIDEAYELNRQEIKTLNELLAECYEIAEPTRIPGYSDEQMFEANAANEFTVSTLREMQSEIVAMGQPLAATVLHVMSNPHTLSAAIQSGLIPAHALTLTVENAPVYGSLTLEEAQALIEPLITATLEPKDNVLQLQKIK